MTRIAFIGLGSMGGPLAQLIARQAFDLTVYDPFPDAVRPFDGICAIAASPGAAARGADMLCICVRDEDQVRDVLFGADGAAAALGEGALVLIHSTISVAGLQDLAATVGSAGIALIDAPVSRTRQTTDERFVFAMLGGDEVQVGRARAVVDCFATDIGHMGPLGAGMATKIANNMVTWLQIGVAVQAADMAVCSGVELDRLLSVMRSNGNLTPTMGAVLAGKFQAPLGDAARTQLMESQGGIGEKDLALAMETAARVGVDTGLVDAARRGIRSIMADTVISRRG